MKIILPSLFRILPSISSKFRLPVCRLFSINRIFPNIKILVFRIPSFRFYKPFIFSRRMIYNNIHHYFYPSFMCFRQHSLKFFHCPIIRINAIIITYIISIVILRRFIHRCNPDYLHPKFLQIIKFFNNSSDIPFSTSSRIIKTLWINLVNHRFMPPFLLKILFHRISLLNFIYFSIF